jgi:excisionase family DNA binding protein
MTTPRNAEPEAGGEFLSPEGLADYLNVPLATVYTWRHKGYGPPAAKIGKHVRYRRAAVDAWVSAQESAA